MRADRLLRLADYLEKNVPNKNFDYKIFLRTGTECGTIGCSWGWCPNVFPEVNWVVKDDRYGATLVYLAGKREAGFGSLEYSDQDSRYSIMQFFDIKMGDAEYLFYNQSLLDTLSSGNMRTRAITLIRDFVNQKHSEHENETNCPMCEGKGKIEVKESKTLTV